MEGQNTRAFKGSWFQVTINLMRGEGYGKPSFKKNVRNVTFWSDPKNHPKSFFRLGAPKIIDKFGYPPLKVIKKSVSKMNKS